MAEKKKKEKKEKKEKPLERWTVKELREEALKLPDVHGAHGMNKEELLAIMRKARGLSEQETKKKTVSVRDIKVKLTELRTKRDEEREQGASRAKLNILRKKLSRLKKQTRQ